MKKLPVLFLLILFTCSIHAQRNANIGIIGGTSYYLGDINPKRHFYKPSPAFGGIYRLNFGDRWAARASGIYMGLKGDDMDFPKNNYPDRPLTKFSTNIVDLAALCEFNFMPFEPNSKPFEYTTYVTGGIGYTLVISSDADAKNGLVIPFGIGVKFNLTRRISSGAEWTFRKTFNDTLDGVSNSIKTSSIHNNDWYSFFGVFITYKFFKFAVDCPAYN